MISISMNVGLADGTAGFNGIHMWPHPFAHADRTAVAAIPECPSLALGEHTVCKPRANTSLRASQLQKHKPLTEQQSSRCTNTSNCSSSSSQSCYLWQGEDKCSREYLQRQGSVSRTKSSFTSWARPFPHLPSTQTHNLSPPSSCRKPPSLPLQGQPFGVRRYLLHTVLPFSQGDNNTLWMAHVESQQSLLLCQLGTVPGGFWPRWPLVNLNSDGWPLAMLATV